MAGGWIMNVIPLIVINTCIRNVSRVMLPMV